MAWVRTWINDCLVNHLGVLPATWGNSTFHSFGLGKSSSSLSG